ncbi:hypothetical protein [Methanoculleus caldifontis]|uniref:hypothetical protein n=1 Tax=Methanoculleus caldifontis TaxID=2651577 RepID=UPI002936F0B3|nr:hypothetical protein [Methanoculleus sp. Wushi-C6]
MEFKESEDYLLELSRIHLNKGNSHNDHKPNVDYRESGYAIVNFYQLLIYRLGTELNLDVKESYNLDRNWFLLVYELDPKAVTQYQELIKKVNEVRNKLAHTIFAEPQTRDLEYLINQAKGSKSGLESLVGERKRGLRDRRTLANEYSKKIEFTKLWFKTPEPDYGESIRTNEALKEQLQQLKNFEKINIGRLDPESLESLISILDYTVNKIETMIESIYSYCPKCGGKIIATTETTTHYRGIGEDIEPYSYTVWTVIKCEKCGKLFEKNEETTDYI